MDSYSQLGSSFLMGYFESYRMSSRMSCGNTVADDDSMNSSTDGKDFSCRKY